MNCPAPIEVWPDNRKRIVPCGKCLACLSNKRSDWSYRLMQEYKHSRSAVFVTLTYHPKFVPDTGVSKRHVQLFMKRLRKRSGGKLRYYLVAEYGSKTGRPHYHMLLFNIDIKDESYVRGAWCSRSGEPFGIVHLGKVTQASIRYCTKYVIQRGSPVDGRKGPFALMSRAYGMGAKYLSDEMIHWHRNLKANYSFDYGCKGRLPRFYKEKIWPKKEERERIGQESAYQARKVHRKNLALFYELYGEDARAKMTEMRNAVISRIHEKVAFTQTF